MPKLARGKDLTVFRILVLVTQCVGLACVGLVIHWANLYGGFSWSDPNLQFNWHPVLMVVGIIFIYGDAIIVYRVFSFLPKKVLKIIHGALQLGAIALSAVALVAVFEYHRKTNKGDLHTLHSWLGLGTVIMFGIQFISGFITFLIPGIPLNWRVTLMPYHRFFGVGIFVLSVASALLGMTQKLLWTDGYPSDIPEGKVGNSLGMLLVVFGFLVAYLATKSSFKRRTLPAERPAELPAERSRSYEMKTVETFQQKPAATVQQKPAATVQQKPAATVQQKPSDAVQQKPAATVQQKPSDAVQQKPAATVQQKPSDAVQQKPAATVQQKPSDAVQQRPSDAVQQKPEEAAQQKMVEAIQQTQFIATE